MLVVERILDSRLTKTDTSSFFLRNFAFYIMQNSYYHNNVSTSLSKKNGSFRFWKLCSKKFHPFDTVWCPSVNTWKVPTSFSFGLQASQGLLLLLLSQSLRFCLHCLTFANKLLLKPQGEKKQA